MHTEKNILIIGGDKRQREMYSLLTEKGINCSAVFSSDQLAELDSLLRAADVVILPLPITRDKHTVYSDHADLHIELSSLIDGISEPTAVIGGMLDEQFVAGLRKKGVKCFDFFADEAFVTYNAFLTAQGAVYLLLENTRDYVVSRRILITGFGRVGKAVSHFMKVMGLDVYVAARNSAQKSQAEAYGYKVIDTSEINSTVYLFDYIVNTVPARIFDESCISHMKDGCVYIELASQPYGAARDDFKAHGKKYVPAASLPGRLYPTASAKAIIMACKDHIELQTPPYDSQLSP